MQKFLSAPPMRLLLVLLALLSGLSLSEVAVASSRAEVAGVAFAVTLATPQEHKAFVGGMKAQRPTGQTRLALAAPLPRQAYIRACSISIPDRPRE
jgi:hypothetical protein